MKPHVIEATPL